MRRTLVPISITAVVFSVWLVNQKPMHVRSSALPAEAPEAALVTRSISVEAAQADDFTEVSTTKQPAQAESVLPPLRSEVPATTPAVVLQMVDQRGLRVLPSVRENEKAFVIEPLDPLWSRSREAEILGQLAQVSGVRLSTVEVECRTSMCRLQFTQNVANGSDEHRGVPSPFYAELLARLGYEQMIRPVMARDNAGTVASLAYLPRLDAEGL